MSEIHSSNLLICSMIVLEMWGQQVGLFYIKKPHLNNNNNNNKFNTILPVYLSIKRTPIWKFLSIKQQINDHMVPMQFLLFAFYIPSSLLYRFLLLIVCDEEDSTLDLIVIILIQEVSK